MSNLNGHLIDEELIRLIDGEMSVADARDARAHCAECSACQLRRSQFERALLEFVDLQSTTIDRRTLESGAMRRAELKDRLLEASLDSPASWIGRFARSTQYRPYLFTAAAIFVLAVSALFRTGTSSPHEPGSAHAAVRLRPDSAFTPGATRPVNLVEVCSQEDEDLDPAVSDSVKKMVFQEYEMADTRTEDYQVDYLINPQLGGTADVRNLWPEPYGSTVWNAHAKDALEDRLHRMVCNKEVDLSSAQREIATDWIAAYRKYFHTENPT